MILGLNYKNGKIELYCKDEVLSNLGSQKEDFDMLLSEVKNIILDSLAEQKECFISKLYLEETKTRKAESAEYEVTQKLKAISNSDILSEAQCRKVNNLIVADILDKLS